MNDCRKRPLCVHARGGRHRGGRDDAMDRAPERVLAKYPNVHRSHKMDQADSMWNLLSLRLQKRCEPWLICGTLAEYAMLTSHSTFYCRSMDRQNARVCWRTSAGALATPEMPAQLSQSGIQAQGNSELKEQNSLTLLVLTSLPGQAGRNA